MWLTDLTPGRSESGARLWVPCPAFGRAIFLAALVLLSSDGSSRASILWSEPGAVLAHDSGPGRDILNGALKRDDASRDTLYFRFRVSPLSDASTEEYYAAFELFEGDVERVGIGNALEAYAYSAFFKTREQEPASPGGDYVDLHSAAGEPAGSGAVAGYELPHHGQERTILFKVQYVPNGDDLITAWLNPDLSPGATEVHQPEILTTRFSANASFDEIRLRHGGRGGGWVFSDLAVATSFADFVDPSRATSASIDPGRFFDLQPVSFDAWLRDPGMPQAPIRTLAQTIDGYLWLAGSNQLSRFDGVRFVLVNLPAEFDGDNITTLAADSSGALWIGMGQRGLARYFGGQFEVFTARDGVPTAGITAIAEAQDGAVWIGTRVGILSWDHHGFHKVQGMDPLDRSEIRALFQDAAGILWIAVSGKGVFQVKDERLSQIRDSGVDPFLSEADCFMVDPGGKLWVGAGNDVVLCRDGAEWHRYRTHRKSTASSVRALAVSADGTVWAGSPDQGLLRFKQGKLAAINSNGGVPQDQVFALLVDQDGDLWVGGGSGLQRIKCKPWLTLGAAEGLGDGIVSCLAEVAPGVIWVTQPGRGLHRWEGDAFRRLSVAGLSPADRTVGPILVTSNHACWLACTNGLLLFRDPQAAADEALLFELPHATITALAEAQDGSLWAGTKQGQLWRLQEGRWRLDETFSSPFAITSMATESNGTLWVGTDGGGLYIVNDVLRPDKASASATIMHFDKHNGLAGNSVRALYRDNMGTFWIGTEAGGLTSISNQVCTVFSSSALLPGAGIKGILEDRFGRLWLNRGAGLTCNAKPRQFDTRLELLGIFSLTLRDLDEPGPEGTNVRAFPQLRDSIAGRLWFGTGAGIVVVDPQGIVAPAHSGALILEEVLVDGAPAAGFNPLVACSQVLSKSGAATPALHIGPGRHRLELRYTTAQLRAPETLRFRYRMDGLDGDWVEAGTSRSANYSYVPPGDYRFSVELHRPDGKFERAAGLQLSFSPYFWQRPGVITASVIILLAASGASVRFAGNRRMKARLRHLEEQNLLESERMRIAQDLHDQMGARLCRISYLSEHARQLDAGSNHLKEQVATIAHDSRELLHSLDEIVWAVNPHYDTLEHVGSYIGQYAQEYFQGTGIECVLDIANDFPHQPVSSQIRHHLFLAVHEALTNVLKHSRATLVKVAVLCTRHELEIRVKDNGSGFTVSAEPRGTSSTDDAGNGLRNMRQRIETVGGRCELSSTPGHGTSIRFLLPLALNPQEPQR